MHTHGMVSQSFRRAPSALHLGYMYRIFYENPPLKALFRIERHLQFPDNQKSLNPMVFPPEHAYHFELHRVRLVDVDDRE